MPPSTSAWRAAFLLCMTTDTQQASVQDWINCESSFVEFLRHVKIRDATKGVIPLELWPHLVQIAKDWQTGESWIEGKARQIGFSWLLAAYDLWMLTFREQARILSISMGERESVALLENVKFIHERLPDHLRMKLNLSNREMFVFADNGSGMRALPSTENAGRSFQATLVQFDEFGFHPYAGANYDSTRAAVADGGQMLIISTGNGPENMFANLWDDEEVPFKKRFTGWRAKPTRDQDWYDLERRAYLSRGRIMFFNRENPETIE